MFYLDDTSNPLDETQTIDLNEPLDEESGDGVGWSGIIFLIVVVIIIMGYYYSKKKEEDKQKKKEKERRRKEKEKEEMLETFPSLVRRMEETQIKMENLQKGESKNVMPKEEERSKKIISIACGACGELNRDGSIFCFNCGATL